MGTYAPAVAFSAVVLVLGVSTLACHLACCTPQLLVSVFAGAVRRAFLAAVLVFPVLAGPLRALHRPAGRAQACDEVVLAPCLVVTLRTRGLQAVVLAHQGFFKAHSTL